MSRIHSHNTYLAKDDDNDVGTIFLEEKCWKNTCDRDESSAGESKGGYA